MNAKGLLIAVLLAVFSCDAMASGASYTGVWSIDVRSAKEKKQKVECGYARFELTQDGDKVTGSHTFSTPGCGRENEGGPETVKGLVVEGAAVLLVTSARTGDMAMGKAVRKGNELHWNIVHEFKRGEESDGDSPLILSKGVLMLGSAGAK
jgi:hypothetical protein